MNAWAETQLKDIALKITKGTTPTTLGFDFTDEGINFIKAESVTRNGSIAESTFAKITTKTHDALKRSQIIEHDILVSIAGAYLGKIGLVRQHHVPANTNQAVAIVRLDRSKACPGFIKNFLLSPSTTTYLNMLCPQSAQPNLNLTQLGKIRFQLPSLRLQRKIAAILTAYDDLIEVNKRRIALLEKMAEELYREWFVRLRFPGYRDTSFVKGVPEGWEITTLNNFCETVTDGTHDTPKPMDTGHLLVTGKNIKNGQIDFTGAYFISEKDHREISKRSGLKEWDILYSNIGTVGQVAIVGETPDYSVKNVIIFRPRGPSDSLFLFHMFRNPAISEHLIAISSGASQQFIGLGTARGFKVLVPDTKLIDRFAEYATTFYKQRVTLIETNRVLIDSRDHLLPRLISGKLSVEDLDIQFPPSMKENAAAAPAEEGALMEARHA